MKQINILLFDNFTTLDALGPAEVFSRLDKIYDINYYSENGGLVSSSTKNAILTDNMNDIEQNDIVIIPGGWGTRELVKNTNFINKLTGIALKSEYVLCVCTGSALLSKTGLLDNRKATSNKLSWNWVIEQNRNVQWIKRARWVVDGKYYTSAGITAGIDMSLGFVSDIVSNDVAKKISNSLEYVWNENKDCDPFSE
jgi:putative intracellular protease/amidase